MQKIPSLFMRNYETDRLVRNEVVPGSEWVIAGEGRATRKFDGTCCMVRNDVLYRRYEVKKGKKPPQGFEPASDVDPVAGKQQGWIAVGDSQQDQWHREAFEELRFTSGTLRHPDGFYELIGPKIQGNPEHAVKHYLIPHGQLFLDDAPRDFDGLKAYFADWDIEGIVWHHPDGRMVKIKGKDFGIKRAVRV